MKKILAVVLCLVTLFSFSVSALAADKLSHQSAAPTQCLNGSHLDVRTNDYIAPTCTKNGFKGGVICVTCGTVLEDPVVLPATHKAMGNYSKAYDSGFVDRDGDGFCDFCGLKADDGKNSLVDLVLRLFYIIFG